MKKESQFPWKGCLIGCGAVVFLAILATGGCFACVVRTTTQGFEGADRARVELEERFGAPDAFEPWPGAAVPPDRIEAFLTIRESLADAQQTIVSNFQSLPITEEQAQEIEDQGPVEKFRSVIGMVKSGVGLGGSIGKLVEARNNALLGQGMSLGEYTYLYVLSYYSWLGNDPGDGLGSLDPDHADVRIRMDHKLRGSTRARWLAVMGNHLRAAAESDQDPEWISALEGELDVLRDSENARVPWGSGLPDAIAASFEPYRERLEATYVPFTNDFALERTVKSGPFSFHSD